MAGVSTSTVYAATVRSEAALAKYEWEYDLGEGPDRSWQSAGTTVQSEIWVYDLPDNSRVNVRVREISADTVGPWSRTGSGYTHQRGGAPNPVSAVSLVVSAAGVPTVTWTLGAASAHPVARHGVRLWRASQVVASASVSGTATSHDFATVTDEGLYHATVRPVSTAGSDTYRGDWVSS